MLMITAASDGHQSVDRNGEIYETNGNNYILHIPQIGENFLYFVDLLPDKHASYEKLYPPVSNTCVILSSY